MLGVPHACALRGAPSWGRPSKPNGARHCQHHPRACVPSSSNFPSTPPPLQYHMEMLVEDGSRVARVALGAAFMHDFLGGCWRAAPLPLSLALHCRTCLLPGVCAAALRVRRCTPPLPLRSRAVLQACPRASARRRCATRSGAARWRRWSRACSWCCPPTAASWRVRTPASGRALGRLRPAQHRPLLPGPLPPPGPAAPLLCAVVVEAAGALPEVRNLLEGLSAEQVAALQARQLRGTSR